MTVSPWAVAAQNIFALLVTGFLADRQIIPGTAAEVMILAILGVIAIPAFKGRPPVGVFVLMGYPAVRLMLTLLTARGA